MNIFFLPKWVMTDFRQYINKRFGGRRLLSERPLSTCIKITKFILAIPHFILKKSERNDYVSKPVQRMYLCTYL